MKDIDILAIGDITTDCFIRLKDAEVNCDVDKENCKLCLRFGDKVPYESVEVVRAVGNSANAAVSAARLGLQSALVANVGDDENGKECLEELEKNKVITDYVRTETGKRTNYHYVLWYDVDRTILVKHEQFTYSLENVVAPKWIYLSSLGDSSLEFHNQIAEYLQKNPETKLAFQPGTFQIKLGADALKKLYERTEIFICNIEESQLVLNEKSRDLPILLKGIVSLGPKIAVITDSINGAYAYDGSDFWFMPVYPHTPFERTGAGDAYASTIVSCLAMDKTLEETLKWAGINSMSVTQYVGAQKGLLSQEKIEEYLAKAPESYEPKKI
ncbi:MAG: carbohydrate kinase family protein [Candidatus Zambryskibacteria bacterium]|nr:carbohydrate kinase family protein [Candidatus Zambryskibacteria bacterium]